MKTIFYCGHLSDFGLLCMKAFVEEPYFELITIVLGDLNCWTAFRNKLAPGSVKKNDYRFRKRYDKQLKAVEKILGHRKLEIIHTHDANQETHFQQLADYDLIVSAAFPQIFSAAFLEAANQRAYNLHPSFLPRCRGAHPIYWTIASREPYGGVSCHLLTSKLDQGAIAVREKINFDPLSITYKVLKTKIENTLPILVVQFKAFFVEEREHIKQYTSESSFYSEDLAIHHKIYWDREDYTEISAKIRAGNSFTKYKNEVVHLTHPVHFQERSKHLKNQYEKKVPAGTIVHLNQSAITVKLNDGYLVAHILKTRLSLRSRLGFVYRNLRSLVVPSTPEVGDTFN